MVFSVKIFSEGDSATIDTTKLLIQLNVDKVEIIAAYSGRHRLRAIYAVYWTG